MTIKKSRCKMQQKKNTHHPQRILKWPRTGPGNFLLTWTSGQQKSPSHQSHTDHHITHQHLCHMLTITCQKYSCHKCIYFRVKDKVSGRASHPPKVSSLVDFKIRIIQDLKSGCSCLANFKIRISQELK